jgi:hypothetical protein
MRGVKGVSINRMFGEIRLPNGSHADFWSVDHTERAGRGRRYHLVLIDESAHDEGYPYPQSYGSIRLRRFQNRTSSP